MSTSRSALLKFHECHLLLLRRRGKIVTHESRSMDGCVAQPQHCKWDGQNCDITRRCRTTDRPLIYSLHLPGNRTEHMSTKRGGGGGGDAINILSSRFGRGKLPSFWASHVCRVRLDIGHTLEAISSALGAHLNNEARTQLISGPSAKNDSLRALSMPLIHCRSQYQY